MQAPRPPARRLPHHSTGDTSAADTCRTASVGSWNTPSATAAAAGHSVAVPVLTIVALTHDGATRSMLAGAVPASTETLQPFTASVVWVVDVALGSAGPKAASVVELEIGTGGVQRAAWRRWCVFLTRRGVGPHDYGRARCTHVGPAAAGRRLGRTRVRPFGTHMLTLRAIVFQCSVA